MGKDRVPADFCRSDDLPLGPDVQAFLNAVDPGTPPGTYTSAYGFFPIWYQDTHGRGLELCLSTAEGANGPLCVLLANPGIFDPALPISFPGNFPTNRSGSPLTARLLPQVLIFVTWPRSRPPSEAASRRPTIRSVFARIRFFADVPTPGTYTVTHPYGVEVFEVTEVTTGREIQFTRDIGIGAPGDFTGALKGDIGPFLVAAAYAWGYTHAHYQRNRNLHRRPQYHSGRYGEPLQDQLYPRPGP